MIIHGWDDDIVLPGPVMDLAAASIGSAGVPEAIVDDLGDVWAATDNDGFKLLPDLRQRIGVGGTALQRWLDAGIDHLPAEQFVQHRVRRVEFAVG